jgi:hypothetical protein
VLFHAFHIDFHDRYQCSSCHPAKAHSRVGRSIRSSDVSAPKGISARAAGKTQPFGGRLILASNGLRSVDGGFVSCTCG